jgi:hypothetical protein
MSGKDIIKISLALVFISLLLWLIFGEDTTLNGNEDGEGNPYNDPDFVPYGSGPDKVKDGLVVYKTVDKT